MQDISTFSLTRVGLLLQNEYHLNKNKILLGLVSLIGFMFLFAGLYAASHDRDVIETYSVLFPLLYFIGGFGFTSVLFYQLHQANQRTHYLTIPASSLEKFASKWLLATVGWSLLFYVVYMLGGFVFGTLGKTFNMSHAFDPSFANQGMWIFFLIFLSVQSLFLIGAIYFNGYNFFKTVASIFATIVAGIISAVIIFRVVMNPFIDGMEPSNNFTVHASFGNWVEGFIDAVFLYGVVLAFPILMWTVAYFKLKEKEVK